MKLGFYYHNSFTLKKNRIYVPGYIGVFIDALASEVSVLHLFLEEATTPFQITENDYCLTQYNIQLHNLGPKSTFVNRLLFSRGKLKKMASSILELDAMLIRCPTPLAPTIHSLFAKKIKVYPLVVGNYTAGLHHLKQPVIRKIGIYLFTYYYQYLHNKMIAKNKVFVNSVALLNEYQNTAHSIELIKTTTLNNDSFSQRDDTCNNNTIEVLFTGRINFQKGLRELVSCIAELKKLVDIRLHIVGWEEEEGNLYKKKIEYLAEELNVFEKVIFHGKKKIGSELKKYYEMADIYVLPTYHEGFPRTIWEAMACCCPVITTNVGSIPYYLKNNFNAILIEPKNITQLSEAILKIIKDSELRKSIIKNAYQFSKEVTLEAQTKILISKLEQFNKNE